MWCVWELFVCTLHVSFQPVIPLLDLWLSGPMLFLYTDNSTNVFFRVRVRKISFIKKILTVIYSDFYNFLFVLFFHKVIVHKELSIQSDEDTISMPNFRYATITFNIIYLRAIHFPLIKSDIFSTLIIYLIPKKIWMFVLCSICVYLYTKACTLWHGQKS